MTKIPLSTIIVGVLMLLYKVSMLLIFLYSVPIGFMCIGYTAICRRLLRWQLYIWRCDIVVFIAALILGIMVVNINTLLEQLHAALAGISGDLSGFMNYQIRHLWQISSQGLFIVALIPLGLRIIIGFYDALFAKKIAKAIEIVR